MERYTDGSNVSIAHSFEHGTVPSRESLDENLRMKRGNGLLTVTAKDVTAEQKNRVLKEKMVKTHVPQHYMQSNGEIVFNKNKKVFPVRFFAYSPTTTHGFSIDDADGVNC